jgi:hypothetical protein
MIRFRRRVFSTAALKFASFHALTIPARAENLGRLGQSQGVPLCHFERNVLDQLHRADLVVDQEKRRISRTERANHISLLWRRTSAADRN